MLMSPRFGHVALNTSISSNLGQVDQPTAFQEMSSCIYISNSLEQPLLSARRESPSRPLRP